MTAKKKTIYKKRQDRKFLVGRLYTDYQSYVESEEITHILQMDTVYNDISNGPFIQTSNSSNMGSCLLYITTRRLLQIWLTD